MTNPRYRISYVYRDSPLEAVRPSRRSGEALQAGRQVDGWMLLRRLGGGGNADVWRAVREGKTAALKILRNPGGDRWARFRDEIEVMQALDGVSGVLPLLAQNLPETPSESDACWLATPVALTLRRALGQSATVRERVGAIAAYAGTLSDLADRGIHHRDLKPENLFQLKDQWVLGDFGLATYPEKEALTRANKQLGPLHYMAPEMLLNPESAEPAPADVYSLAKTLWVLVAGQRFPHGGQMRVDEPLHQLASWVTSGRTRALDHLIEQATSADPRHRPSMKSFAHDLQTWLAPAATAPPEAEIDINGLRRRIEALSAVGMRRHETEQRWAAEFVALTQKLEQMVESMRETIRALFPIVSQELNGPVFTTEGRPKSPYETDIQISVRKGSNADPQPVAVAIGAGVRRIDQQHVCIAGRVWIEEDAELTEGAWSEEWTVHLGGIQQESALSNLAVGLASALNQAAIQAVERMERHGL